LRASTWFFNLEGFMNSKESRSSVARDEIYRQLHGDQLSEQEAANAASAGRILDIVMDYYRPTSVLDVGCGIGTWLKVARSRGISDIRGIEGFWLDKSKLRVEPGLVEVVDLEKNFNLGRRFDLVISLEVAEHLSESAADHFIESLTAHAPLVSFSAAIPYQGGDHHVNEQFLPYWVERFSRFNFRPVDVIRGKIWNEPTILWWLRQNAVLFVEQQLLAHNQRLCRAAEESAAYPLSLVHPEVYLHRMHIGVQAVGKMSQLADAFGKGGLFRVTVAPDGMMKITREG
jgi:SAM-dependent methyltransferase